MSNVSRPAPTSPAMMSQSELVFSFFEDATTSQQLDAELDQTSQGLPRRSQIILIVIYTLTTVLSVVGNIFVIIVFTIGRRSRTDLRWFLTNLAVADLIMAIFCMPFTFTMTMLSNWIFSAPMCPVVLYMQTVSVTVSVCTIMAIGVDRFWVVNYPLRSRITKSRSKAVIAAIWVIACLLSSVQLYVGKAVPRQEVGVDVMDCSESWPDPAHIWRRVYTFFILITTYLMPLAILSFTYGFVSRKLWRRTAPGNADEARDSQQLQSKRKVIKMLVIVVTLFGVCWLPLHVFIIVIDFNPQLLDYKSEFQKTFVIALYYCVHWLAMSNSFVNPIIYGFLNDSFRNDLKWLLCKCMPCCRCFSFCNESGLGTTNSEAQANQSCYRRSIHYRNRLLSPRRISADSVQRMTVCPPVSVESTLEANSGQKPMKLRVKRAATEINRLKIAQL